MNNNTTTNLRERNLLRLENKGWRKIKSDRIADNYQHPDVDSFTLWIDNQSGTADAEYETNLDNVSYHWSQQILDHMPHHLNT